MLRLTPGVGFVAGILLSSVPDSSAQEPAREPAVTRSAEDAQLQWGPCPEFMPQGCAIGVLHGDPSKPNVDVFLKVPAKATISQHWHTSAERMVMVSGEMHVTYQGQPKQVLKPGMYAYGPPKLSHEATCASSTPCVLFIAFESAVDAVLGETPSR